MVDIQLTLQRLVKQHRVPT